MRIRRTKQIIQDAIAEVIEALREDPCKHTEMRFHASTGAESDMFCKNVSVGVTARCGDCGEAWTGDVIAGLPEHLRPKTINLSKSSAKSSAESA